MERARKEYFMFRANGKHLSLAAFGFDLCAVFFAWITAYWIRFNGMPPEAYWTSSLQQAMWVLPVYGVMFRLFGLYRGMWVFASLPDLVRIAKAVVVGALAVMIGVVLLQPLPTVPRSVLLIAPVITLLMMGGARALYRTLKEFRIHGRLIGAGRPVLVLGAGRAGAMLARELAHSPDWRLVGLLDDDRTKHGREVYGHRILGSIEDVGKWALKLHAEHVIIAMPAANAAQQRRVATLCVRAGVHAMVLPALHGQPGEAGGPGFLASVRQIDPEDLLGREQVSIDSSNIHAMLSEKVVMVTGGGGSIGSELCRQIVAFGPARLVVFDSSEFSVYRLGEELHQRLPDAGLVQIVGDVKDALLVDAVIARYAPSVIFHAAAYKHVPLMEEINAWQAVRNNVLGTLTVAQAALARQVKNFVLISTDKAVNPTNVMGASKRLAEMVCQSLQQTTHNTYFTTVRFGNVLGSTGSVIPKFQEQIAKGGPVTVTHPEITRFFMTIPEASQLVLQAASMGEGGEIFLLDMGEPVKIVDLARDMIRLYGFDESQIKIRFSGLRPGEKLYEELLACEETTLATRHPKLRVARARAQPGHFIASLTPWLTQSRLPTDEEVRRELGRWVPEYTAQQRPLLAVVV